MVASFILVSTWLTNLGQVNKLAWIHLSFSLLKYSSFPLLFSHIKSHKEQLDRIVCICGTRAQRGPIGQGLMIGQRVNLFLTGYVSWPLF